jgi:hypothetical protein
LGVRLIEYVDKLVDLDSFTGVGDGNDNEDVVDGVLFSFIFRQMLVELLKLFDELALLSGFS